MITLPTYVVVLMLLAGTGGLPAGALLGAFLFYRGRTGKSPVPTVREVKASLRAEEEKVEEKPRFAPPPRLKA